MVIVLVLVLERGVWRVPYRLRWRIEVSGRLDALAGHPRLEHEHEDD